MEITPYGMENSSTAGRGRWAAQVALVALAAGLVYLNSLGAPFHYDDYETVLTNRNIRIFDDISSILLHSPFRGVLFLSFALSYRLTGAAPLGFHLFNTIVHMMNAVLVLALVRQLVRRTGDDPDERRAPLVAGLFFAVHPAFTEAVTYISSRSSLLATSFYLGCVLLFLAFVDAKSGGRRNCLFAAAFASFVLGTLTKELLATVPIMLVLIDWIFLTPPGGRRAFVRRLRTVHAPFWGVLLVGGAVRLYIFATRELVGGSLPRGVWENLVTQAQVIVVYLRLLVAPYGLNLIHDFPTIASFWQMPTPLATAFLGVLVWAGARLARRDPLLSFCVLWFFVTLLPSSSFIPFQEALTEHHLYLPGVAVCIAAGLAAARLTGRLARAGSPWRIPAAAVVAAVIILFAGLTVARNRVWSDELALWRDTVAKSPATWATHYGYGDALRRDAERRLGRAQHLSARGDGASARTEYSYAVKDLHDSVEQYTLTLLYRPDHVDSLLNRGICHAMIRQAGGGSPETALAEVDFARVLELEPKNTKALNDLGNLALIRGDQDTARDRYTQVTVVDPRNLNAHINLGSLYYNKYRDREKAYAHYAQAYQILLDSREFERAKALYRMLKETGLTPATAPPAP